MRTYLAALALGLAALTLAPVTNAQEPPAAAAKPFSHEKGRFNVVDTTGWGVEVQENGAVFSRMIGEAALRCEALAITTPRTVNLSQERMDLSVKRFSIADWRKLVRSLSFNGVRFQGPDGVQPADLGGAVGKRASWKHDQDKKVQGEGLYFAAPGVANLVLCTSPKGDAAASEAVTTFLGGFRRNAVMAPKA